MKVVATVLFSVFLFPFSAFYAQTEGQLLVKNTELEEAAKDNSSIGNDTLVARQYLQRANYFYMADEFDSLAILATEASRIYEAAQIWEDYVAAQLLVAKNEYLEGKLQTTAETLNKTLTLSEEKLGEKHPATARVYTDKGILELAQLKPDLALEYFTKAHNILANTRGQSMSLARLYSAIAYTQSHFKEDVEKAINYCETAVAILRNHLDANDKGLAKAYTELALLYHEFDKNEEAMTLFNNALQIFYKQYSESLPFVASIHYYIGQIQTELEEYTEAVESYQKAVELLTLTVGENNRLAVNIYSNLGQLYAGPLKERTKALPMLKKAIGIDKKIKNTKSADLSYRYRLIGKFYMGQDDI